MNNKADLEKYWTERYKDQKTGWDIGYPSTPLKAYIDQLENKSIKILLPGAGNSYEAEYLHNSGFLNVYVLDIAQAPLDALLKRVPSFPKEHILKSDFFDLQGNFDLILEQTFFCSFPPTEQNRNNYSKQMHNLLSEEGKLVGLWFDIPLTGDMVKRPFGGTKDLYLQYLSPYFKTHTFAPCYNSIAPRAGSELFGIFKKR